MASSTQTARTIILVFSSGNISESALFSNTTFQTIVGLTVNNIAEMRYILHESVVGAVITYSAALEITLISSSTNDATIVSDLPTLATSLNVSVTPIPTWSWVVTWSY